MCLPPSSGPDAEDDLHPSILPRVQCNSSDLQPHQWPGCPFRLQLFSDCNPLGLPKPDPGPVGLPAPQGDPPSQVLHRGKRSVQLLHRGSEGDPDSTGRS